MKKWLAAALLAVGMGHAVSASAQEVTLALPTTSLVFLPNYVAADRGFWQKRGLEVKSPIISGAGSSNAVLSGGADFTTIGPGSTLRLIARGQKLSIIGTTVDRFLLEFVLRKDVAAKLPVKPDADLAARVRALKGISFGVDSINGYSHSFLRYLTGRYGLDAERDVVVSPVQPGSLVPSLAAKRIDGFIYGQPWSLQAVNDADGVIWISGVAGDVPELAPFAYMITIAKPETCQQRRAVCEKLMAGLQDALDFIHADPEGTFEVLRRKLPQMDQGLLRQALSVVRPAIPRSTETKVEAIEKAQEFGLIGGMMAADEQVKDWRIYIDNSFVRR